MASEPAPFDVVEASRRVWLARWNPQAASGMATFTAILRTYQLLNDQVNGVMRSHGLTFARYEVLAWLASDPEPSLTLSWISRTLRIPPATVTNIIDHLEREKLIRRKTHPSDARTTLAVITPRGRRVADDATQSLNTQAASRFRLSAGVDSDHLEAPLEDVEIVRAMLGSKDAEVTKYPAAPLVRPRADRSPASPSARDGRVRARLPS